MREGGETEKKKKEIFLSLCIPDLFIVYTFPILATIPALGQVAYPPTVPGSPRGSFDLMRPLAA